MNARQQIELHHALVQGWNIKPVATLQPALDEVLDALAARVAFMLRHNYERLLASLYILDVPERESNEALAIADPAASARALAEAILHREIQRVETRSKYRSETAGIAET